MIWNNRLYRIGRVVGPACVVAVIFAVISIWLGRPSLSATGVILAGGALIGLTWAATANLTAMQSAAWIDARLNLQDLLATAWTVRNSDQAWNQTIVAMAEARCRNVSPADAMPPMSGGRTWSAIALGAALAFSLGMIEPMKGQNTSSTNSGLIASFNSPSLPNRIGSQPEQSRPAGDVSLNEPSNRAGGPSAETSDEPSGKDGTTANGSTSGTQSGAASGLSRTPTRIQALQTRNDTNGSINASAHGTISGGGSGTAPTGEYSATASGTGNQSPTTSIPPWQSNAWPAAQSAALQSLRSGAIDPAYQTIVRDYFSRP
jgi:hypothetical protein